MKRTALFLAGILAISSLSGCGAKNSASDSSEPFEGKYVVTADYVKENLDDIIIVDARGEDEAKKGTVKGAVATTWQYLATCEDGEAGDANWGCILDTKRLSERLGELGLAKDKEIVLFSNAEKGWGEDGRIAWELIAAGYEDVKIVDGGIKALKAAGVETVKGAAEPKPVSVEIDSIDETHVINTDELKEIYDDCKIVDTRTDKEYNGKTMYGEANGGHLPGAIQIRYTDLFNSDSTLKSNEDLTKMVNMIESQFNNGDYTAMDLVRFYRNFYPQFRTRLFHELMEQFHLEENRRIATFSKGMKKQVLVIIGVCAATKYLFCDETFDGLDPVMRQAVKSLFAAEIMNREFTPVIASHNLRELEDICDHVGLLHKGGILLSKDLEDMKFHIHKIQCVLSGRQQEKELEKELQVLKVQHQGSLLMITARGTRSEIMEKIQAKNPLFMEVLPLTLEEIFISETEVAGYEIKNLF